MATREISRVTIPLVLSLIGQQPARRPQCGGVEVSPLSPQFVGGGFGGWYLPLSLSLSHSSTLKRQLESGSLTINGILETRTVREGMADNERFTNQFISRCPWDTERLV